MEQAKEVGAGGFFFPTVYRESKPKVVELLGKGEVDLIETSRLSLADQFMAFIIHSKFLEFADRTYPNPRKKNQIPVWFVISCQFILRLNPEKAYSALGVLLKSGPILSRIGFNVGAPLGFNDKNKYPRETPVHQDSVRKFFKDTNPAEMRQWFREDLQKWFRQMECFDTSGVFILDQTHLVVPDNTNYQDAVRMPVDEHGQRYKNLNELTQEQKKALPYHPCYTLSTLLHLSHQHQAFHVAGYEFGPGNEDELPQAEKLIKAFFRCNKPGSMKLLIVDRGYISGSFITWCKTTYGVDVLVPLKTDMEQHKDALAISEFKDTVWTTISTVQQGSEYKIIRACTIEDIQLWDECQVPLFVTVVAIEEYSQSKGLVKNKFCLCSTKKFNSADQVVAAYQLRTNVEECFRQLKNDWHIHNFPSPDRSLLEAHVGFTLLTYSLLQLYLMRQDLQEDTNKFLSSLRREELNFRNNLIVYAGNSFGYFSIKEYSLLISQLTPEARDRFNHNISIATHQQ